MSELVYDCPRCGASHITFDVNGSFQMRDIGWKHQYEAMCTCRKCKLSSIFVLLDKNIPAQKFIEHNGLHHTPDAINDLVDIVGVVSVKDRHVMPPPLDVPENVAKIFGEGTTCLAVECFNAAGTMFRLCVDLATHSILPAELSDGPNGKIRRSLGLRMEWLFDHGLMPHSLRELSTCVKEDGNDGAHEGTLAKADAEDLLDFTRELLEQIYSAPAKLARAKSRREARRLA